MTEISHEAARTLLAIAVEANEMALDAIVKGEPGTWIDDYRRVAQQRDNAERALAAFDEPDGY